MKGQKQSALLLMVMIFVLGGGFTYWQYSVMKGVQRLAILEDEVPTKEEVDQQLTQTRTEMEQFQQQLSHLERGVPPVAYIPTMLSELEALGKQYNIKVTGVKRPWTRRQRRRTRMRATGLRSRKRRTRRSRLT